MSTQLPAPPPAHGVRIEWPEVPRPVRDRFEVWAGSPVVRADNQRGGFSPGVAARVLLADGRRMFVKAVSSAQNPDSPNFARREARNMQVLPPAAPAPRLLWLHDQDGWVLLAMEEIPGKMPEQPWQPPELARVLAAMDELVDILTPSPIPLELAVTTSQRMQDGINGWGRLIGGPAEHRAGLDSWILHHLDRLAELEAQAPAAVAGSTLLHFDIRADNILLTPERVWFVDWPHASVGAAWVDLAAFATSVALNGGPDPDQVLQSTRHGRSAGPSDLTAFVAALGGFFTHRSLQPPPPGLPTVRAFQAAYSRVTCDWLRRRLGF